MKKNAKEIKEIEVIEAEPINVLETIKVSALIDVSSWKEKQLKLVAENTFFEITDNKTYEAGKKHRTNVVKGRTELQNQDKLVASKFATIRKEVGTETATLIEITQPLEDKWQEEVKAWEERKAREKKEADDAEALRVKTINDKIDETETSCYEIIQKMIFSEIEFSKTQLFAFFTIDFDFEEYDILFDQAKSRVEVALENKVNYLTASENQRLDNIRLEEESKELKRLADLQAERLTAIMPYVAFGQSVDLTKLSELTKGEWEIIFDAKKALFDADVKAKKEAQEKLDAENLERENKAKADKEKIFEIRRGRLAEIGLIYNGELFIDKYLFSNISESFVSEVDEVKFEVIFNYEISLNKIYEERKNTLLEIGFVLNEKINVFEFFIDEKPFVYFSCKDVKSFDWVEFEERLDYSVSIIKTELESKVESEKQKEVDEQLSKDDAERLKNENKARMKRLSVDKKVISESLEVYFADLHLSTENEESLAFIITANTKIQALKNELLTELEKL